MTDRVTGIFPDRRHAEAAMERLRAAGFSADEVSTVAAEREQVEPAEPDTHEEEKSAVIGAAAGGALGAAGGFLLGITALAVPGIGPLLAAGPIATSIAGLVAGAGTGGLLGALIGSGIPESEAGIYEEAIRRGDVLVSVSSPGRAEEARLILEDAGAGTVHGHDSGTDPADAPLPPAWGAVSGAAGATGAADLEQGALARDDGPDGDERPVLNRPAYEDAATTVEGASQRVRSVEAMLPLERNIHLSPLESHVYGAGPGLGVGEAMGRDTATGERLNVGDEGDEGDEEQPLARYAERTDRPPPRA